MNKIFQIFSLSFIVWVLLLISSCSNGIVENTNNDSSVNQATTQENITPEEVKILPLKDIIGSLTSKISENENFNMCAQSSLDICMKQTFNDSTLQVTCDDYLLEENRIQCKNTEITNQAKEAGDSTLCDTINGDSDSCKFEIITAQGIEKSDVSMCSELNERYSISCNNKIIQSIANSTKDIKLCENIKSLDENQDIQNFEKEMCIRNIENLIQRNKIITQ